MVIYNSRMKQQKYNGYSAAAKCIFGNTDLFQHIKLLRYFLT